MNLDVEASMKCFPLLSILETARNILFQPRLQTFRKMGVYPREKLEWKAGKEGREKAELDGVASDSVSLNLQFITAFAVQAVIRGCEGISLFAFIYEAV